MNSRHKPASPDWATVGRMEWDANYYGTLGIVVACLVALATLLLPG